MIAEIKTALRILTFRATREEFQGLNRRHLVLGLAMTWLVGIGRWWEDPRANLLQHSGIGSVVYIFALAFFLWLVLWPLAPERWKFFNVLTFISLTSPPAILYALPVRHGFPLETAQVARLDLLAIVAGWRVALLAFYLCRGAGFSVSRACLGMLFPVNLIIITLTALNLEKVVFDIMGGVPPGSRSVNDSAYGVLFLITALNELAFIPLALGYLTMAFISVREKLRWRRVTSDSPRN